jgi:uncharacterized protein (DUF983 family)
LSLGAESIALLRPLKGGLIGLQYSYRRDELDARA